LAAKAPADCGEERSVHGEKHVLGRGRRSVASRPREVQTRNLHRAGYREGDRRRTHDHQRAPALLLLFRRVAGEQCLPEENARCAAGGQAGGAQRGQQC
jgi:hypothetical protein